MTLYWTFSMSCSHFKFVIFFSVSISSLPLWYRRLVTATSWITVWEARELKLFLMTPREVAKILDQIQFIYFGSQCAYYNHSHWFCNTAMVKNHHHKKKLNISVLWRADTNNFQVCVFFFVRVKCSAIFSAITVLQSLVMTISLKV